MDINNLCPHCMREGNNSQICPHCGKNIQQIAELQHQLRPFSILQGKYLIGDVLGEGGFGITYIGMDINLEIRVAIKEFYPNGFVTRESATTTMVTSYSNQNADIVNKWRNNFLAEAKALARCAHLPGVVGVKDFFQENNTVYIVQEYLEGQTLKEYLKSRGGKIPSDELIPAMKPIITALSEVHAQGLIHRDISPDNIMLLKDGNMKVLDFGAARSFGEDNEKSKSVLLKPGYAPEEQYRTRGNQGPWSDVYALCATIYKCITGVTPIESMERLRNDELQMPSEMGIAISREQEAALKKGMAVVAENRIQSMNELYSALYGATSAAENTHTEHHTAFRENIENVENTGTLERTQTQSHTGSQEAQGALSRKKNMGILCAAAVAVIVVIAILIPKGKDDYSAQDAAAISMISEETVAAQDDAQEQNVSEVQEVQEADDAILQRIEEINTRALQDNSYENLKNVLEEYCELADEYDIADMISDKVAAVYPVYVDKAIEHVEFLEAMEDVSPALYSQMSMELDDAMEISGRLQEKSMSIDSSRISDKKNEIAQSYKQRLIVNFDETAIDLMDQNGVVSRSALWNLLEGADQTGLFDEDDVEDPLRLRYIAAYTLNLQSQIESLSAAQAVVKIYDELEKTDYNPVMVYYLASYGDAAAYGWYEQICAILRVDMSYMGNADMINFIYIYNVDNDYYGDYSSIRKAVREYMKSNFSRP